MSPLRDTYAKLLHIITYLHNYLLRRMQQFKWDTNVNTNKRSNTTWSDQTFHAGTEQYSVNIIVTWDAKHEKYVF